MAAIVFTDIVGSTATRVALGEEGADALRRIHDRLLAGRVEANHGRILRYQGDGLVAAFSAASQALTAAVEIQQAAASYSRRRDALAQLRLRIGVSVGEVAWEDGDCFGIPLVEAARLEAAAGSGQILCTEQARLVARGRGDHTFRPIGFLEVKGLPEPLAACEVIWEPDPDRPDFPLPGELGLEASRPFVGREVETERAAGLIADPERERLAILWLRGEPGIGKTRLAAEIARQAHDDGAVVLFGRCSEDVATPYQPFIEALHWFVPKVAGTELADRLGGAPDDLARLEPEIRRRLPDLASSPAAAPEIQQYRLFESVRSWLAAAGSGKPVVAVFDDVHWASAPTLALLGHVARSADPSRTLLVCTVRSTLPDENPALDSLMDELVRRGVPVRRIEVDGLDENALSRLLEEHTGRPKESNASFAARVFEQTAGNPLFVHALLAEAAPGTGDRLDAGQTLAATVTRRVARLGPQVSELLRTAAVVGLDFEVPVLARAAAGDEVSVLYSLEAAAAAGLVDEQGPDHYRFRHALIRSALLEQYSRSRRMRVHLEVADALEALHHSGLEEHAGRLAHHLLEALPLGTAGRAYSFLLLSGERATELLGHSEAALAYEKALELIDRLDAVDPGERFRTLLALGDAQRKAGDMMNALETLRRASFEAARRRLPEEAAGAAVAFEDTLYWMGLPGDQALEVVQPALSALPAEDSELRALTLATLSRTLATSGLDPQPWASLSRRMAERLGDEATTFRVKFRTTESAVSVEQAPASRRSWGHLRVVSGKLGETDAHLVSLAQLFWAEAMLGNASACDELYEEHAGLAGQLRQSRWDYWSNLMRSFRAMTAADLPNAERHLEAAEALAEGYGWAREGLYAISMFLLRREQGRLSEVAPALQAAAALNRGRLWRPGLAALYMGVGQAEAARVEYEAVMAEWADAEPSDSTRELSIALTAEVCSALADAAHAPALLKLLAPCSGRFLAFLGGAASLGPADRLLGMLASAAGQEPEASRWHSSGLALARKMDSPLWIAHCLCDYSAHQISFLGAADPDLLKEAFAICEKKGLDTLAGRIGRLGAEASTL